MSFNDEAHFIEGWYSVQRNKTDKQTKNQEAVLRKRTEEPVVGAAWRETPGNSGIANRGLWTARNRQCNIGLDSAKAG